MAGIKGVNELGEEHGWIDPEGFEEVDTDAEVDEGAAG